MKISLPKNYPYSSCCFAFHAALIVINKKRSKILNYLPLYGRDDGKPYFFYSFAGSLLSFGK